MIQKKCLKVYDRKHKDPFLKVLPRIKRINNRTIYNREPKKKLDDAEFFEMKKRGTFTLSHTRGMIITDRLWYSDLTFFWLYSEDNELYIWPRRVE